MADRDLTEAIRAVGLANGLATVRVASAEPFAAVRRDIEERRGAGLFGDMRFTTAKPEVSCDPGATLAGARSLVVAAYAYWRPEPPADPVVQFPGRIARFSWADWYVPLRRGLRAMSRELRRAGWRSIVLADSNQLVDRAGAARAGIGWWGKNTHILNREVGSWMLLGAVVTDADLSPDGASEDSCGSCSACLPACPTGAFVAPGVLDARRCISALLQAPGSIPAELRAAIGNRFYGCDDCQDCCPPSRRSIRSDPRVDAAGALADLQSHRPGESVGPIADMVAVLDGTDDEILRWFARFYIPHRDPRYLRRNAAVVLGNLRDQRALPALHRAAGAEDQLVAEHARWATAEILRHQSQMLAPPGIPT